MRRLPVPRTLCRGIALISVLALSVSLGGPATALNAPDAPATVTEPQVLSVPGLSATVATDFPQVISYEVGDVPLTGRTSPTTEVLLDGQASAVTAVTAQKTSSTSVAYDVALEAGASFTAEISVDTVTSAAQGTEGAIRPTLTFRITSLTGGSTIEIPDQSLVSVSSEQDGAAFAAAYTGTARGATAQDAYAGVQDVIESVTADTAVDPDPVPSSYLFLSTSQVAVGMETNATPDQPTTATQNSNGRWTRQVVEDTNGSGRTLRAQAAQWTYRSASATEAIGDEQRPYATLVFTSDANSSGAVDWQDAAVAYADIAEHVNGAEDNSRWVVTHIPFNFGSQATHPFLRTADDVKRINVATDGLGQRVLLKGYESEGHDSAHPDYAGNINERAGGAEDMATLFTTTRDANAVYGVHVNTTEAYPEAQSFGSLDFTGGAGWDWLGKSYYIDQRADLGTGKIVKRFQELRDQFPLEQYPDFRWIYIDVYYGSGWTSDRLGRDLNAQGWEVGSEWSDKFERFSTWSHWANDERYGGSSLKGMNSQIIRFIDNANKDTWNPDVALGYPQIVEFEGWTGHQNQQAFYANLWGNNLPTKFLQASRLMQHDVATEEDGRVTHTYTTANGTVASGTTSVTSTTTGDAVAATISADMAATRQFTYDNAVVLQGTSYLLPWTDNGTAQGSPRLYYYNPEGTDTTWTLTSAYASQTSLTLYRLTDTGRVAVTELPVLEGAVTIPSSVYADIPQEEWASTAFVLYPSSTVSAAPAPQWGVGTVFTDPGFNSGDLTAYTVTGQASVTKDVNGDPVAAIGSGEGSVSQTFPLAAGTYEGSAWVEIGGGAGTRDVSVSVSGEGVAASGNQQGADTSQASPQEPLTVAFEDFEHVPQGWGPFVKGDAGETSDPRTVLASLNAPFTQKGWTAPNGRVKATDDVIGGHWSLKSHSENGGLVYRTVPQTVRFEAGHRYRVSFDYENSVAGPYKWVTGYDALTGEGASQVWLDATDIPVANEPTHLTDEFTVGACGPYWVGLADYQGGVDAADLTLDNFRVEDLGVVEDQPACASATVRVAGPLQEGMTGTVTTSVVNTEAETITDLSSTLEVPEGWVATPRDSATLASLGVGETFEVIWDVTAPAGSSGSTVTLRHQASYRVAGRTMRTTGSTSTTVLGTVGADSLTYLSDLPVNEAYNTNGWGPVERDLGNGEREAGDGPRLSIGGVEYDKGLGTHAPADVGFDLDGQCHTFAATVGVDGIQGSRGSVSFQVLGTTDGVTWTEVVPSTDTVRGGQAGLEIQGDVTGMTTIRLVVGDGGDGVGNDHADWADARVACGTATIDREPDAQPGSELSPYTGEVQVVEAPAPYSENPVGNMLDGDDTTFYDKDWVSLTPHPSTILLGLYEGTDPTAVQATEVSGLSVTGRGSQANGRVEKYEVYVGQDAANVNTLVASGTLRNTGSEQRIVFDRPVSAKLIKLVVTSSYKTRPSEPDGLLTVAEILPLTGQPAESKPEAPEQEGPPNPGTGEPAADPAAVVVTTSAEGLVGQDYLSVGTVNAGADVSPVVATRIDSTVARNWVGADQKNRSYFQRVPVRFSVAADGTAVTFTVAAGDGDTPVLVDDLRLVRIDAAASNDLVGVDCAATPTPEACTSATANARIGLSTPDKADTPGGQTSPQLTPEPSVTPSPVPSAESSTEPGTDPSATTTPGPTTPPSMTKPLYVASMEAAGTGTPITGDWDGDGRDSWAVRVGSRVVFFNVNALGALPVASVALGRASDEVYAGDWDGDGKDTIALRRGASVLYQTTLTSTATTSGTVDRNAVLVVEWDGSKDVLVPRH